MERRIEIKIRSLGSRELLNVKVEGSLVCLIVQHKDNKGKLTLIVAAFIINIL